MVKTKCKKKFLSVVLSLIIGISLAGCSSSDNTGSKSSKKESKIDINIPTAATTGSLYPLGASLSNLWNEKVDGVKVSSQASNGGIDNLNLMQNGEAQVSMGVASIVYQSYNGEAQFKGRANKKLRVIAGLYYNPNQIVVRKSSGIEKITDLKGKKFATGAPGSTTEDESRIHLEQYGLKYPGDIKAQHIGFTESTDLMRNKQLDGAWIMAGVPTAAVTEICTTADGKLVPIDEKLVNKLKEKYPWYSNYVIKKGTYERQKEDINTSAIKMILYTSEDVPEKVVYQMTKSFWENIDELKRNNKSLDGIKVENALKDISKLPVHDGSMKYYNEVGVE